MTKARRRFIHDNDVGILCQYASDDHHLLIGDIQLSGLHFAGQIDFQLFELLITGGIQLFPVDQQRQRTCRLFAIEDVFRHRKIADKGQLLRNDGDAQLLCMAEALDLADVIIFMDHGNIVQMAPPEEMLAHPASGQIQDFLGNFIDTHAQKELTAADFMRSGVSTVSARRGVNECVSKMQRRNVDTLIVVDDQDRYQGTVSIADIRLTGHVVKTIEPLIRCNTPTVHTGDSAKDCFDLLISSGAPYLIVLNEEEKVDGIITKTSMTSAMAEQLWG